VKSVPGPTKTASKKRKRPRRPLHVALTCNLKKSLEERYAEWDTEETIAAVEAALSENHKVTRVVANDPPTAFRELDQLRPDIVFNMVEGLEGVNRESHVPAMLEALGIPFTGSDPLTLSICLDKARTKEILAYHGVPTPRFVVIEAETELSRLAGFPVPAMVKPIAEGSSRGITNDCVVHEGEQLVRKTREILTKYAQPALVEEFLPGAEYTVALLGNGVEVQVLPLVQISFDKLPPDANPIYSYEAKWVWDTPENPVDIFRCPAQVEGDLKTRIEALCRRAFRVLRVRDWARIDVRLDARGEPQIIEVNPLPGILPKPEDNSCFPKAARTAGISYPQLINRVLDEAWFRYGRV
jgi:D-alanine-D-alanine ligase